MTHVESILVAHLLTHPFCNQFSKNLQVIMAATIREHRLNSKSISVYPQSKPELKIVPNKQTKKI